MTHRIFHPPTVTGGGEQIGIVVVHAVEAAVRDANGHSGAAPTPTGSAVDPVWAGGSGDPSSPERQANSTALTRS